RDGQDLVCAEPDAVRVRDGKTGAEKKVLHEVERGNNYLRCIAASADGKHVAISGEDGQIRLWSVATWEGRAFSAGGTIVSGLAFSPDGRRIASAGGDRRVRIWDVETGGKVGMLKWHGNEVRAVAFLPDGKTVVSSTSKEVHFWNAATGEELVKARKTSFGA